MLRIISLILAVVLFAGAVILISGYMAVPSYSNSITFEVPYSLELTWQELLDIKNVTKNKSDVASVDVLEEFGKLSVWQENLKDGGYRIYRMNKRDENKELVLELIDSSYGLKGIWTFDLKSSDNRTEVTISEKSTLADIKIRGYRVIFGREADLLVWQKYIKVGLAQSLLVMP